MRLPCSSMLFVKNILIYPFTCIRSKNWNWALDLKGSLFIRLVTLLVRVLLIISVHSMLVLISSMSLWIQWVVWHLNQQWVVLWQHYRIRNTWQESIWIKSMNTLRFGSKRVYSMHHLNVRPRWRVEMPMSIEMKSPVGNIQIYK